MVLFRARAVLDESIGGLPPSRRYQILAADARRNLRRYLFVAIDRATRRVFLRIYGDMNGKSSVDLLRRLKLASPIRGIKLLTDNGSPFSDRFTTKDRKPSGLTLADSLATNRQPLMRQHRIARPVPEVRQQADEAEHGQRDTDPQRGAQAIAGGDAEAA